METKFTKGPWFIEGENVGPKEKTNDQSSGMMMQVCYIEMYDYSNHKSNAHLIAAAPEMYEMLEMASKELYQLIDEANDQRLGNVNSQTETPPDLHDMETLHLIGKLLAKARGES